MYCDLVLYNARIHTLDPRLKRASAVAVRGDRIVYVGDDATAREILRPGGEAIDMHGRCIIPGLTDAHLHFSWYARALQSVDAETPTLDQALGRVQARAQSTPPGAWITGSGWNHNVWSGLPSAADLDRAAPDHPVALDAKSGHALWVNSKAMALAGITAATPDPEGGQIVRDAAGQPTGILLEDAVELVQSVLPTPTPEEMADLIASAFPSAYRAGLTGVHCFDSQVAFSAYQILRQRGQLGLRIVKSIPRDRLAAAIGLGLRTGLGDDWLTVGSVKMFADGALGPQTAWMLAPYENSENVGIVTLDKDEMLDNVLRANSAGLSTAIHAIGDRACRTVLDTYEKVWNALAARLGQPIRNRIEHVQLLHPDDFSRLSRLGVVGSMQPIHATSDMLIAGRYWGKRSAGAYAFRTLLDTGTLLAFGSDCPVEKFDPLAGIHAAVTRRRADGAPGPEGWYPGQRLSVEEAVRGFTFGAAFAAHKEERLGTVTAGKLADFTVLNQDIFDIEPMDILQTQVDATIIGGRFAWRADSL